MTIANLVKMDEEQVVTSSRQVAEVFGKEHRNVMSAIRDILGDLSDCSKVSSEMFYESEYINSRGRTYTEYLMNRDGFTLLAMGFTGGEALQWKMNYIEAFNELEEQNKALKESNKELHRVAVSDDDLEKRQYEANVAKYGWKMIKMLVQDSDYREIETTVEDILYFHTCELKKIDRAGYKTHQEANNTEYKQIVRDRLFEILDEMYHNSKDNVLTTVIASIKEDLLTQKIETANRSNGKLLANRDNSIEELRETASHVPRSSQYVVLDVHGFSNNYALDYHGGNVHRSYSYNQWIDNFPGHQLPEKDYWEVDWTEPVAVYITYVAREAMDIRNLDKSILDQVITREYGEDDNIVDYVVSERVGTCDGYADGKIGIYITNLA